MHSGSQPVITTRARARDLQPLTSPPAPHRCRCCCPLLLAAGPASRASAARWVCRNGWPATMRAVASVRKRKRAIAQPTMTTTRAMPPSFAHISCTASPAGTRAPCKCADADAVIVDHLPAEVAGQHDADDQHDAEREIAARARAIEPIHIAEPHADEDQAAEHHQGGEQLVPMEDGQRGGILRLVLGAGEHRRRRAEAAADQRVKSRLRQARPPEPDAERIEHNAGNQQRDREMDDQRVQGHGSVPHQVIER